MGFTTVGFTRSRPPPASYAQAPPVARRAMNEDEFRNALATSLGRLEVDDEPLREFYGALRFRRDHGPVHETDRDEIGLVAALKRVLGFFGEPASSARSQLDWAVDDSLREQLVAAVNAIPAITLRSTLRRLERRGNQVSAGEALDQLLSEALREYARTAADSLAPGP